VLELAQVYQIALPEWIKPGKAEINEPLKETIEKGVERFKNEGGRMVHNLNIQAGD
jgi:hypothetical protein